MSDTATLMSDSMSPNYPKKYDEEDIYNAEEIGLIFDLMPHEIQDFRETKCENGELSDRRVTIFICANMSGTDKRKMLIIGSEDISRSFKNMCMLPFYYARNEKSWMTSELFKTYIYKWDEELREKERSILLLIHNRTFYTGILNLKNIKRIFLPLNSDSALRQGVIRTFKTNYRKYILEIFRDKIVKNITLNIPLFYAIQYLYSAWRDVTEETIKKCFYRTIIQNSLKLHEKQISLTEWLNSQNIEFFKDAENLEDFISVDDGITSSCIEIN